MTDQEALTLKAGTCRMVTPEEDYPTPSRVQIRYDGPDGIFENQMTNHDISL